MTQESPSVDHRTTFSGCIFATKENLLNSNISSTCRHNMVNVGPLTAEIRWWVWGTPANFKVVSRLGCVTARHSGSGCQPNFEALNRGRHLYSAGRPSRWALAHILVCWIFRRSFCRHVLHMQAVRDCQFLSIIRFLSSVYTIQPVVNRLSNRFDNRVNVCIHDTTGCQTRCQSGCQTGLRTGLTNGCIVYTAGCQTGCTTRFYNRLIEQWLFVQHGCQTGCLTGLYDRFDNRFIV